MTVAVLWAYTPAAHAGMLPWMDRLFTFREDQKPAIQPTGISTPKHVLQPYYPTKDHNVWSNYYTRPDLQAQDYLSSSASKVMRPPEGSGDGKLGWDDMEKGARQASIPNIHIGEPGMGLGMLDSDANVGRETKISTPIHDWREGETKTGLNSRPGDFDYKASVTDRGRLDAGGSIIEENLSANSKAVSSSKTKTGAAESVYRHDPRYVEFNDGGMVTGYKVQKGDTLSTISAQPAIYGKSNLWPLIYSANHAVMGKNPNNLKHNEKLNIPREYSDQQAKDAQARAAKGK
jgi:hypothetical protein